MPIVRLKYGRNPFRRTIRDPKTHKALHEPPHLYVFMPDELVEVPEADMPGLAADLGNTLEVVNEPPIVHDPPQQRVPSHEPPQVGQSGPDHLDEDGNTDDEGTEKHDEALTDESGGDVELSSEAAERNSQAAKDEPKRDRFSGRRRH